MMRLTSLTLSDYRSVSGTIVLPLDAPIVLVHGPNGIGKTSVLSAIQLALTGSVPDLARMDPHYARHLLNFGAGAGKVELSGVDQQGAPVTSTISIGATGSNGEHFLGRTDAQLFSERCYLAQSTLGKLLEIYQYADPRHDSPLTMFVKDLLGLDRIDALIDGLRPANDVRNTRKLVPELGAAEQQAREVEKSLESDQPALSQLQVEERSLQAGISKTILNLDRGHAISFDEPVSVERFLNDDAEATRLFEISRISRQLELLALDWQAVGNLPVGAEIESAEKADLDAAIAAQNWQQTIGPRLEAQLKSLQAFFPNLPLSGVDPELARTSAAALVEAETRRCQRLLAEDMEATRSQVEFEQSMLRLSDRLDTLADRLSASSRTSEPITRLLADLIPFIQRNDCPVCSRDFGEVSDQPLTAFLATRIAELTEKAGLLEALFIERNETLAALENVKRRLAELATRHLDNEVRASLRRREAALIEAKLTLGGLAEGTRSGALILTRASEARSHLVHAREKDRRVQDAREALVGISKQLGMTAFDDIESVPSILERLHQHAFAEQSRLARESELRRSALISYRELRALTTKLNKLSARVSRDKATLTALKKALGEAEERRSIAKSVASAATRARFGIISRVFNESLNTIWRELFIRLAPNEPFVPLFRVPNSSERSVTAVLETIHRSGIQGGSPGAMLSSGNLNTAALTLFLALHLSTNARLPWLFLDDPVQSMDEVHIAQFAALLRTLTKGEERQVVLAVHDRQLFEYLSLELGPAFDGDRLITVELGRSANGLTIADHRVVVWHPDAAAAA